MGLKAGEMGGKVGEKEKFSFWHFCGEKSEKVTKLRSGYAAGLPACGTAKTQRKRGLLRPRQINRASYTARKALRRGLNTRSLALTNPHTSALGV